MLYFITILIVFSVLAFAGIALLKKFRRFQKRKEEIQMKESDFIDKLLDEGEQEPKKRDIIDDKLSKDDVRAAIFEMINKMSEEEMHRLLKDLEEGQIGDRRQCERKDFLRVIDYQVGDHYYRDFIQNISETGLFIKPSKTFSVGQTVSMTFMSPDEQSPFKINGEIVRVHTGGIGIKFKIESQVQRMVLKSYVDMIQSG
jgi:Tfp pilus assembly protein PilZ